MITSADILKTTPEGFYIGIDPGENGAVVILDHGSADTFRMIPTKGTEGYRQLCRYFSLILPGKSFKIFLERERVSPIMSPKAATTFITGYGYCLGALENCGAKVDITQYDPPVWMRALRLVPGSAMMTKTEKKKHSETQIRERFDGLAGIPSYAVDAFGILLAGLIQTKGRA